MGNTQGVKAAKYYAGGGSQK